MANRLMSNRLYAHEKDIKYVFAKVAIGATGAPTLNAAASKGVKSITRNGVGDYTIVFGNALGLDPYVRFLGARLTVQDADGVITTPILGVKTNDIADGTKASINFILNGITAGAFAAVEAADGATLYLEFAFGDSTAP